jgi:hypothetical protein
MLWARENQLVPANPAQMPVALNQGSWAEGVMVIPGPSGRAIPTRTGPAFRMLRKMLFDPLNGLIAP